MLTLIQKVELEDTKVVIRMCNSKDRQHNEQKKKRQIYKELQRNLKVKQHEPHYRPGVSNSCSTCGTCHVTLKRNFTTKEMISIAKTELSITVNQVMVAIISN